MQIGHLNIEEWNEFTGKSLLGVERKGSDKKPVWRMSAIGHGFLSKVSPYFRYWKSGHTIGLTKTIDMPHTVIELTKYKGLDIFNARLR